MNTSGSQETSAANVWVYLTSETSGISERATGDESWNAKCKIVREHMGFLLYAKEGKAEAEMQPAEVYAIY